MLSDIESLQDEAMYDMNDKTNDWASEEAMIPPIDMVKNGKTCSHENGRNSDKNENTNECLIIENFDKISIDNNTHEPKPFGQNGSNKALKFSDPQICVIQIIIFYLSSTYSFKSGQGRIKGGLTGRPPPVEEF